MPATPSPLKNPRSNVDEIDKRQFGTGEQSHALDTEAGMKTRSVELVLGYWVGRTKAAVEVVCEKEIEDAMAAAKEAGYGKGQVAFSKLSTLAKSPTLEGEFGGVEIEEEL